MWDWIGRVFGTDNRQAQELARLRLEVEALKATAAGGLLSTSGAGSSGLRSSSNLALARVQESHNRGWVFSCVRAIAQRVAGQPVKVGRLTARARKPGAKAEEPDWIKAAGREVEPLADHQLLQTLADPNEVMVSWTLLYLTAAGLQLTGRSFWWLDEGEGGREVIWPLPASWVRPIDEGKFFARYEVRPRGALESFDVPGEAMVRFSLPDPANPLGALSPLQAQSRAVVADEAMQEAQGAIFKNGIFPGMAIRLGRNPDVNGQQGMRPELNAAQRAQILGAVKNAYRGLVNFGEPIILDNLIEELFPISNKPNELDFLNSGSATKERITQSFGCNPIVLGQVENANRASAVVADENFATNTINPLLALVGQTLTSWMRYHYRDPALVVWLDPARPRDEEAERARMSLAVKAGAVTKDEVRQFAGLAPLARGGDELVAAQPGAATGAKSRGRRAKGRLLLPGRNGTGRG